MNIGDMLPLSVLIDGAEAMLASDPDGSSKDMLDDLAEAAAELVDARALGVAMGGVVGPAGVAIGAATGAVVEASELDELVLSHVFHGAAKLALQFARYRIQNQQDEDRRERRRRRHQALRDRWLARVHQVRGTP